LHPDIVDAAVIGVPDARYGEELMAFLRIKPGADAPTTESTRAFCNGKIAHYKVPRYVEVVDEFPMTVTGKVRKVELREQVRLRLEPGASVRSSRSPTEQRISSSGP
jgi:fatty-acyl-CoA synthase